MTVNPLEKTVESVAEVQPSLQQKVNTQISSLKESTLNGIENLKKRANEFSESSSIQFSDTVKEVQQRPNVQISPQNILIITYVITHIVMYNLVVLLKPSILTDDKGELITFRVLISSFLLNNLVLAVTLRSNPELVKKYLNLWN